MNLRELEKKSIKVILKNRFKSGLFPASPKGTRYWPHCYPRDQVMINRALNRYGFTEETKKSYLRLIKLQKNGQWFQRYDGRTGRNSSYKPSQIDSTALVLWGFWDYYKTTEDIAFLKTVFSSVKNSVKLIKSKMQKIKINGKTGKLVKTSCSVHEYPKIEQGFEIWANFACCAGLQSAVNIANELGKEQNWKDIYKNLKKDILKLLWVNGQFVKRIYRNKILKGPDIAELSGFIFGVLDARDKRIEKTVERITKPVPIGLRDKELFNGICRYPEYWKRHNGGFGPWVRDCAWLGDYYFAISKRNKGKEMLEIIKKLATPNGLLPEHVSTIDRVYKYLEERLVAHKNFGLLKELDKIKGNYPKELDTMMNITKRSRIKPLRKILIINELKAVKKVHKKREEIIVRAVPGLLWSHAEFLNTLKL